MIEHAKKHNYAWTEVRPNTILGVSTGFMNQAVTTAIYAAVQKFKGEDLIFPGNTKTWDRIIVDSSTAINNARFQVWCTDEANRPKTANEAFNINDGEPQKLLGELWTELGRHLGMKVKAPDAAQVKTDGPTGQWARTFSLVEWSKKPENGEAWKKLVETHGGDPGAFEDAATFAFADFTLGSTYHQHGSIEKARKAGWTGSVDSAKEGYIATLERMQELGTLPKI